VGSERSEKSGRAAVTPVKPGTEEWASDGRTSRASHPEAHFDAVVFAGGGCRCFWQAGFWSVAASTLGLAPRVVVGVSAGSAFACAALSGKSEQVLEEFKLRCSGNPKNVYPRAPLRGERLFPHEEIYRDTILDIVDEESLSRLHAGPEIRILITRPPKWLGARTGLACGVAAAILNDRERLPHARWGRKFGFIPEVVSVNSCRQPQQLAELILHSSCTPPLVPLYRRDGRIVLDGGLLDNAPAHLVGSARSTLVLLSRHYDARKIPNIPGRTYVQPSRPVPVSKWDYTSPDLVQETWDLGCRDGVEFARSLGQGRAVPARVDRRGAAHDMAS
jgi:predicted acylesterase/phospholipase RssA